MDLFARLFPALFVPVGWPGLVVDLTALIVDDDGWFPDGIGGWRARISLNLEIRVGIVHSRLTPDFGGNDGVTGAASACEGGIGVVVDFVWHGGIGY